MLNQFGDVLVYQQVQPLLHLATGTYQVPFHAPDFISARNYVEAALGKHIEKVLGVSAKTTSAHPL